MGERREGLFPELDLRRADDFAFARTFQYFQKVTGLVGRVAKVETWLCLSRLFGGSIGLRRFDVRHAEGRSQVAYAMRGGWGVDRIVGVCGLVSRIGPILLTCGVTCFSAPKAAQSELADGGVKYIPRAFRWVLPGFVLAGIQHLSHLAVLEDVFHFLRVEDDLIISVELQVVVVA